MSGQRALPYRHKPSSAVAARIAQIVNGTAPYRLFLVQESGPTSYVVRQEARDDGDGGTDGEAEAKEAAAADGSAVPPVGTSAAVRAIAQAPLRSSKFKVLIGSMQRCSCGERDLCLHILFVMLKIFRIAPEDPRVWQLSLTDAEVEGAIKARFALQEARRRAARRRRRRGESPGAAVASTGSMHDEFGAVGAAEADGGAEPAPKRHSGEDRAAAVPQRALAEGELCPICQDDMTVDEVLAFCKSCGNNVHNRCMRVWAEHRVSMAESVTCPLCREDWGPDALDCLADDRKKAKKQRQASGVHHGVSCRACKTNPIYGKRMRCLFCDDVDLCARCFNRGRHSRQSHGFVWRDRNGAAWQPAVRQGHEERAAQAAAALAPELSALQDREITDEDYDLLLALDRASHGPTLVQHMMESLRQVADANRARPLSLSAAQADARADAGGAATAQAGVPRAAAPSAAAPPEAPRVAAARAAMRRAQDAAVAAGVEPPPAVAVTSTAAHSRRSRTDAAAAAALEAAATVLALDAAAERGDGDDACVACGEVFSVAAASGEAGEERGRDEQGKRTIPCGHQLHVSCLAEVLQDRPARCPKDDCKAVVFAGLMLNRARQRRQQAAAATDSAPAGEPPATGLSVSGMSTGAGLLGEGLSGTALAPANRGSVAGGSGSGPSPTAARRSPSPQASLRGGTGSSADLAVSAVGAAQEGRSVGGRQGRSAGGRQQRQQVMQRRSRPPRAPAAPAAAASPGAQTAGEALVVAGQPRRGRAQGRPGALPHGGARSSSADTRDPGPRRAVRNGHSSTGGSSRAGNRTNRRTGADSGRSTGSDDSAARGESPVGDVDALVSRPLAATNADEASRGAAPGGRGGAPPAQPRKQRQRLRRPLRSGRPPRRTESAPDMGSLSLVGLGVDGDGGTASAAQAGAAHDESAVGGAGGIEGATSDTALRRPPAHRNTDTLRLHGLSVGPSGAVDGLVGDDDDAITLSSESVLDAAAQAEALGQTREEAAARRKRVSRVAARNREAALEWARRREERLKHAKTLRQQNTLYGDRSRSAGADAAEEAAVEPEGGEEVVTFAEGSGHDRPHMQLPEPTYGLSEGDPPTFLSQDEDVSLSLSATSDSRVESTPTAAGGDTEPEPDARPTELDIEEEATGGDWHETMDALNQALPGPRYADG